jgi:hypothetical protein
MIAFAVMIAPVVVRADDTPSKLEVEIVVPAELASIEKQQLEISLFEFDPRIADKPADLFDSKKEAVFAHTKGKETKMTFTLGDKVNNGKTNANKSYYVTVFVLKDGKRTHIGEKDGKSGLTKVLTNGQPNKVTMILREVKP